MSGYNPATGLRTQPVLYKDGVPVEPHIGISDKEASLRFAMEETQRTLDRQKERRDARAYETQVIPEGGHGQEDAVPARDEAARMFADNEQLRPERAWQNREAAAPTENLDLPGGVKTDRAESMGEDDPVDAQAPSEEEEKAKATRRRGRSE